MKDTMRIEIFKDKSGVFYLIPPLTLSSSGILNNKGELSGYIYELDLNTGKFWQSEYFDGASEQFNNLYEAVGWAQINKIICWNIAPKAIDKENLPNDCFVNKIFFDERE